MNRDVAEKLKNGATTSRWARAPAIVSLLFSATTAWLTHLYVNAHELAYHQPGQRLDVPLRSDLVDSAAFLSAARLVPALTALILAMVAFRGGPRWLAWLSLIISVLVMVSLPFYTFL
jgi:hypothetical protein